MKVLLTGATGFLGKYVIEELKNNNYKVVALEEMKKLEKHWLMKKSNFIKVI